MADQCQDLGAPTKGGPTQGATTNKSQTPSIVKTSKPVTGTTKP